jgi:uncharacterized protein YuzE
MTILYTKEANILSIHLEGEVEETIEFEEGLFLDLAKDGRVIGIETHNAKVFLEQASSADGLEIPNRVQRPAFVDH